MKTLMTQKRTSQQGGGTGGRNDSSASDFGGVSNTARSMSTKDGPSSPRTVRTFNSSVDIKWGMQSNGGDQQTTDPKSTHLSSPLYLIPSDHADMTTLYSELAYGPYTNLPLNHPNPHTNTSHSNNFIHSKTAARIKRRRRIPLLKQQQQQEQQQQEQQHDSSHGGSAVSPPAVVCCSSSSSDARLQETPPAVTSIKKETSPKRGPRKHKQQKVVVILWECAILEDEDSQNNNINDDATTKDGDEAADGKDDDTNIKNSDVVADTKDGSDDDCVEVCSSSLLSSSSWVSFTVDHTLSQRGVVPFPPRLVASLQWNRTEMSFGLQAAQTAQLSRINNSSSNSVFTLDRIAVIHVRYKGSLGPIARRAKRQRRLDVSQKAERWRAALTTTAPTTTSTMDGEEEEEDRIPSSPMEELCRVIDLCTISVRVYMGTFPKAGSESPTVSVFDTLGLGCLWSDNLLDTSSNTFENSQFIGRNHSQARLGFDPSPLNSLLSPGAPRSPHVSILVRGHSSTPTPRQPTPRQESPRVTFTSTGERNDANSISNDGSDTVTATTTTVPASSSSPIARLPFARLSLPKPTNNTNYSSSSQHPLLVSRTQELVPTTTATNTSEHQEPPQASFEQGEEGGSPKQKHPNAPEDDDDEESPCQGYNGSPPITIGVNSSLYVDVTFSPRSAPTSSHNHEEGSSTDEDEDSTRRMLELGEEDGDDDDEAPPPSLLATTAIAQMDSTTSTATPTNHYHHHHHHPSGISGMKYHRTVVGAPPTIRSEEGDEEGGQTTALSPPPPPSKLLPLATPSKVPIHPSSTIAPSTSGHPSPPVGRGRRGGGGADEDGAGGGNGCGVEGCTIQ